MRLLVSFPVLIFLFTSCGKPVLVDQCKQIPDTGWTWADSLAWTFTVEDTTAIYDLLLTVDHGTDYRWQNAYVRFHTLFPGGEHLEEVVSLELQTASGRWLGNCSGSDCSLTIPIQQNTFFNQPGEYRLLLEQDMRQDSLTGLRSVCLRIEDTGNRRSLRP